jgi:hypothetical protein
VLVGEHCGEALHHLGHQTIRLLDGVAGLVDEAGLDLTPASAEARGLAGRKQRARVSVRALAPLRW